MNILTVVLLILLVGGFVALWTKYGRTLFDVAVFIILLFLLIGSKL